MRFTVACFQGDIHLALHSGPKAAKTSIIKVVKYVRLYFSMLPEYLWDTNLKFETNPLNLEFLTATGTGQSRGFPIIFIVCTIYLKTALKLHSLLIHD